MPTKLTESERHRRVVEAALYRLGSFDPTRAAGLARLATTGRSALSTAAGLARSVWGDLEQELQAATVDWLRMRRLHAVWVAAEKWVALETASARAAKSDPSEVPRFESANDGTTRLTDPDSPHEPATFTILVGGARPPDDA